MKDDKIRSDSRSERGDGDNHANRGENGGRGHKRQGRKHRDRGGRDGRHHGRSRHGNGRGRAKRGEARYVFLDVLSDGPKHGYEIIKVVEERSGGEYVPSPGTIYPTLQYLEDKGLVRARQDDERRVYQLTDAGALELEAQAERVAAFWSRFVAPNIVRANQAEIGFLEEELAHLDGIVWNGLRDAIAQGDADLIRQVRQAVTACQDQVREIITEGLDLTA